MEASGIVLLCAIVAAAWLWRCAAADPVYVWAALGAAAVAASRGGVASVRGGGGKAPPSIGRWVANVVADPQPFRRWAAAQPGENKAALEEAFDAASEMGIAHHNQREFDETVDEHWRRDWRDPQVAKAAGIIAEHTRIRDSLVLTRGVATLERAEALPAGTPGRRLRIKALRAPVESAYPAARTRSKVERAYAEKIQVHDAIIANAQAWEAAVPTWQEIKEAQRVLIHDKLRDQEVWLRAKLLEISVQDDDDVAAPLAEFARSLTDGTPAPPEVRYYEDIYRNEREVRDEAGYGIDPDRAFAHRMRARARRLDAP
jgi:hypothetical protein